MSNVLSFPNGARILCGAERDIVVPPGINEELVRWGGLNRFGEPNYRCVWGWSRRDWKIGKWVDRDKHGAVLRQRIEARYEPKYHPRERFYFERWTAPEVYGSREEWERETLEVIDATNVYGLGEFPSRGDYERIEWDCETPDGGFLWPTREIARQVVRRNQKSRARESWQIRDGIAADMAAEDKARRETTREVIDNAFGAFGVRPHIAMPGHTPFQKAS